LAHDPSLPDCGEIGILSILNHSYLFILTHGPESGH
jgi:hypothetical protein